MLGSPLPRSSCASLMAVCVSMGASLLPCAVFFTEVDTALDTVSRCPMPPPRTTTSYAILGLLSVRRWTTYELAKQVQRSLNWFWPRAERKLYDEPKRLVADG